MPKITIELKETKEFALMEKFGGPVEAAGRTFQFARVHGGILAYDVDEFSRKRYLIKMTPLRSAVVAAIIKHEAAEQLGGGSEQEGDSQ